MKNLLTLQIRPFLETRFKNYSLNPDTYLKSLGLTKKVNYDRYAAPQQLTHSQQFQLLLLDMEHQFYLNPGWEPTMAARDWLQQCENLIKKAGQIKVESSWWFTGIFKTQDLEEIAHTLRQVLVYKLTQLYLFFRTDEQTIRQFIKGIPPNTYFQYQLFVPALNQEILPKKNYTLISISLPTIMVRPQNQFKTFLDEFVVFELQEVHKLANQVEAQRMIFKNDLKAIAHSLTQNLRSDNQVNISTKLEVGLLEFDLQLRAMGWLTTVKEESKSLTQKSIRFLKFTAPLTASIGGLLLLMYLLNLL